MTRIVKVEAGTARIPLDNVTSFATRQVSERYYSLVRVTGEDGVSGIGFCYAGHACGHLVADAARHLLRPCIEGQDSFAVERLWQAMYQESLLHGRAGTVMRALSAIDIALWDRNARAAGLPLHRYMGAFRKDSVPAYASGGYYLDGKTPKMLGEEMAGYVAAGFQAVKMKVGRLSPSEEEARIAAVREAIGDDVLLTLDANNAWQDLPTALRYMNVYERYDPYWIEEPFSPDDIDNHARLAAATNVPVATGEIEYGRWRHKELLDKEAAAILQTDAAVCGGISEWRRIDMTAASYGVKLCPHWFHDLHAPLVATSANCDFVEFFIDDKVLNFRRLLDNQLELDGNGGLQLHQAPGLGFDFAPESLDRYLVDGWG